VLGGVSAPGTFLSVERADSSLLSDWVLLAGFTASGACSAWFHVGGVVRDARGVRPVLGDVLSPGVAL
jgi:hypothetical protein